jgi:hypothetical protein
VDGTKYENQSVAKIVISTATDESQTLAFNYASLAFKFSTTASSSTTSYVSSLTTLQKFITLTPHQKPPTSPYAEPRVLLTDKPLNPGRIQTLGAIIAAQLDSL